MDTQVNAETLGTPWMLVLDCALLHVIEWWNWMRENLAWIKSVFVSLYGRQNGSTVLRCTVKLGHGPESVPGIRFKTLASE
eukprot:5357592-Amphidinium_carterae.1